MATVNLDRFWIQLGSILGGFWGPRWGQVGTKSLQKSIQKAIQKMITFWTTPRSIFGGFWLQLAPQSGGGNVCGFFVHFRSWNPLGAILGPGSPKSSPRGLLGPILGDFDLQLGGFWEDFGAHLGRFWAGLVPTNQQTNQPTKQQPSKQASNQPDCQTSLRP